MNDRHRPCQTMVSGTQRARCTYETIWMQTNGTPLLAAKRRSLARMPMAAQDGSCAPGLLYSTAVRLI